MDTTEYVTEMRANLIKIAEDFDTWLGEEAVKYNMEKMAVQDLIKQFLIG